MLYELYSKLARELHYSNKQDYGRMKEWKRKKSIKRKQEEAFAETWILFAGKERRGEKAEHILICEHFEPTIDAVLRARDGAMQMPLEGRLCLIQDETSR